MLKPCHLILVISVCAISSCKAGDGLEHQGSIEESDIVSRVIPATDLTAAVSKIYVGGATGETLYKVWACSKGTSECRLQAVIDADSRSAPTLEYDKQKIILNVNADDSIWDFCNRTQDSSLGKVKLIINYL